MIVFSYLDSSEEIGENDAIYTKVHFQLSIYGTLGN